MTYQIELNKGKVPVKIWTDYVESSALDQLTNLSQMDIIHSHVAAMPDVHAGMGSTVGSVIPTLKAIIPAAVGVDIGCGMIAAKLNITASQLPDNLEQLRSEIESKVPHGRTNDGKASSDKGGWKGNPSSMAMRQWEKIDIEKRIPETLSKHPKLLSGNVNTLNHLGTLGGGNHFIELCIDQNQDVWIMLHSGSRGIGNRLGSHFIALAKKEMDDLGIKTPDKNLAYFSEGSKYFQDYISVVWWAQEYARVNRDIMFMESFYALQNLFRKYDIFLSVSETAVNCHHNYVSFENHFGQDVYVTRKGAISAGKGEKGIIPGSMGTRSYIVEGLGNEQSFCSCSHGAGRTMSRSKAKEVFTLDDLKKQTEGIECRKDEGVIDEIPGAYKDIDQVMENQKDLVRVLYTLKQVVNIKG